VRTDAVAPATEAPPRERRASVRARAGAALRRAPRTMWVCAAVAVLASWVWSVTTPWFQVPDEVVHVGYVHYLGETGKLPRPLATRVGIFDPSHEIGAALAGVPFSYQGRPTWSRARSDQVHRILDGPLGRAHEREAGAAANNPPLYYALEAIPYRATRSANFFNRMLAMRLFSSLLAGFTVAFAVLFLRELLPGTPWAWTVGGLGMALHPLLGFVSGGVNPDALLWAACAALFWLIARSLRRGLTVARGAGIGAALAVGLLTKGAMLGMLPGGLFALAIGIWRAAPGAGRRVAARAAAVGVAVAALPPVAWLVYSRTVLKVPAGAGSGPAHAVSRFSLHDEISYIWQIYLPRLPFMQGEFYGGYPLYDSYFQGFVGRFGYFQYGFHSWINHLALGIALLVLVLAGVALWRVRDRLRQRLPELATYVAMVLALFFLLGVASYQFTRDTALPFEQSRYLLLLLPLYGALLALAARGAGRFGRLVGVAIVALAAAHELFSIMLTLGRYYT
jgi:4-amino-4-deoxy-L-arabinose transferase-like glycosyltransferase